MDFSYEGPIVKLGQEVFYEILKGIIIPAKIIEINDVYTITEENKIRYNRTSTTLWVYQIINKEGKLISVDIETDWEFQKLPEDILEGATHANQFVDIDEPIGYSIQLFDGYDNYDGLYLTLSDAMKYANYAPRRLRLRPHKKVNSRRKMTADFINENNQSFGTEYQFKCEYPEKKIWVKR